MIDSPSVPLGTEGFLFGVRDMITEPMDVLKHYEVRKSRKQKQLFREAAQDYFENLGYQVSVEKGRLGAQNLVIGNAEQAKYLITAHYDTCAGMPFPNLITPKSFWGFLGYQLLSTFLLMIPAILAYWVAFAISGSSWIAFLCAYPLLIAVLVILMVGPANPHTANDNTSGVVAVLQLAKMLSEDPGKKFAFVLFDLEESGLVGSASYRRKHKVATSNQMILNLDCIGEGDELWLFPGGRVRKDPERMLLLQSLAGQVGDKSIHIHEKGFSVYPSDQGNFPYGVGICALKKTRKGLLYMNKIHTRHDTVLDSENVNLLCQRLAGLVGEAVQ